MMKGRNHIILRDLQDRTSSRKKDRQSKSVSIDKVIEDTGKKIRAAFSANRKRRKVSAR